ncbi:MAG: hypothetical protein IT379_09320 [Deltaproteobacteria bacterium]|nr:hypothetical protein [Deltaproteobacteria bacterium]
MATKAEIARSIEERSGERRKKKAVKPRRDTTKTDTSQKGVSATDKKRGKGATATRNESQHAAKKATYALEDSATGRPSRKSTRKSANATKTDSNLRRRQTRTVRAPKARAEKAKARKT